MSNKLRYASPVKRLSEINLLCKQKSSRIRINRCFSCSDDAINIISFKNFFDTDYEKYAIVEISTKTKIIL